MIVLSAKHNFPLLIVVGAIVPLALVAGLDAVVGATLMSVVPLKYIQLGSGLFIVLGIAFLINPAKNDPCLDNVYK